MSCLVQQDWCEWVERKCRICLYDQKENEAVLEMFARFSKERGDPPEKKCRARKSSCGYSWCKKEWESPGGKAGFSLNVVKGPGTETDNPNLFAPPKAKKEGQMIGCVEVACGQCLGDSQGSRCKGPGISDFSMATQVFLVVCTFQSTSLVRWHAR